MATQMSEAMSRFRSPITDIIQRRFSCRTYVDRPIAPDKRDRLEEWLGPQRGPLGATVRFELLAATEADRQALHGLGTYGFIKGATGFIVAAAKDSGTTLEDLGYLMERIILAATDLDLGTCWLGGTFTGSRFAERVGLRDDEVLPAVTPVGYIAQRPRAFDGLARRWVGAAKRLPWERMFFDRAFGMPLTRERAGAYATPLDMVRLAPSASNKQPWRIVRTPMAWHFYLQRSRGYRRSHEFGGESDLQRIDVGIAMCHFGLSARELGLSGSWHTRNPALSRPEGQEYVATWVENGSET
jgi:hypothetical protein